MSCPRCGEPVPNMSNNHKCKGPEKLFEAVEKVVGESKRITGAPFYPLYYTSMAKTCREHGYALTVHGSMIRDLDLVAIPWTEEASTEYVLVQSLIVTHGLMEGDNRNPAKKKPHGRNAYIFIGFGGEESGYIDLSVMPTITHPVTPPAPIGEAPKCTHPECDGSGHDAVRTVLKRSVKLRYTAFKEELRQLAVKDRVKTKG